ncbi:MAG: T9SS type A sorting domain-containing protein [Ignavibacteria bacterium]
MKTLLALTLAFYLSISNIVFAQTTQTYVIFDPNNISTHIVSSGIFDQDIRTSNTPGFMWPKGSNRFAIFTSGLTIAAKVNGAIRLASASYKGEYCPGYISNGVLVTNSDFKLYKVSRGDGPSNPDWTNWYKMIPFGAPYVDVNYNGTFETGIDTPGVKNASQTIFVCMTDGFPETHLQSEGFSGGTQPLFSEMRLTAWGYTNQQYADMQFLKYEIINKGGSAWDSTFMAFVCDPDLGNADDDYIGCDTSRNLAYVYNYNNMDGTGNPPSYGANPPAAGMILLKGARINGSNPVNLDMTSFCYFVNISSPPNIICEQDPNLPQEAYYYLKGRKSDGSYWRHPYSKQKVLKVYTGEPETFSGWTERGYNGNPNMAQIKNCIVGDTITTFPSPPGDRRYILGSGSGRLIVNPGDTQKIVMCQLIARGTDNFNSVTKLKKLSDAARNFYNTGFVFHTISGMVRYTDNNQPVTSGMVKALKFDATSGNILVLDSANIQPNGTYMLGHIPQDSVDIGLYPVTAPPRDYLISYYPSTIYWEDAVTLYPIGNMTNVDLGAIRIQETIAGNSVNGKVMEFADKFAGSLKDANIYAKNGNTFVRCAVSDGDGVYHLTSLPSGSLKIIATRLGYKADSTNVTVTSTSIIDSVNFYLNRVFVGVIQQGNTVPEKYYLSPNYPNPFNPVTNIKFDLPESGLVRIKIYNLLGKEVTSLVNSYLSAGKYTAAWDASSFPSGVYFYRMEVTTHGGFKRSFVQSGKMILLK